MTMKNRYAIHARISERQFRQIVRLFALDLDATQIAALSGLNRNTVNRYLRGIRERIAEYCESQSPFSGKKMLMSRTSAPHASYANEDVVPSVKWLSRRMVAKSGSKAMAKAKGPIFNLPCP